MCLLTKKEKYIFFKNGQEIVACVRRIIHFALSFKSAHDINYLVERNET